MFVVISSLALAGLPSVAGCGGDDRAPAAAGGTEPTTTAPTTDPCTPPVAGCACTKPGTTLECKVYRTSPTGYISCSSGTMTCGDAGVWSGCEGAAVVWDGG